MGEGSGGFRGGMKPGWAGWVLAAAVAGLAGCQTAALAPGDRFGVERIEPATPAASAAGGPTGAASDQPGSWPEGRLLWDGLSPAQPSTPTVAQAPEAVPLPRPPHDLWRRLRAGMAITPARGAAAERVTQQRQWYEANAGHIRRVFTRARPYLFDIVEAVEREGLPMEIALLPAVESAFMPTARSSAAADGLWQFIAPTGRRFNLQQHLFQDDRRNVREATRAALAYLKALQARYGGDMQLALAAYNCGEGCIDRAIRKARAAGLPGGFEDLSLVKETAEYVPRLLALAQHVAAEVDAADAQGQVALASLPPMPNAPAVGGVRIGRDIDLKLAASLAGISLDAFKALNPQHKKPVIVAAVNTEILLPLDRQAAFERALAQHRGPLASWVAVKLQRHRTIESLSAAHGANPTDLRAVNGVPVGHLVAAGSTVLVPRGHAHADIAEATVHNAMLKTAPVMVKVSLNLPRKAGWAWLAQRMGVSTQAVQRWNPQLRRLKPGRLTLTVPYEVAQRADGLIAFFGDIGSQA